MGIKDDKIAFIKWIENTELSAKKIGNYFGIAEAEVQKLIDDIREH